MNNIIRSKVRLNIVQVSCAVLMSIAAGLASAQGQQGQHPQPGGERRGPPPEALAACKSLSSGAECSFTGPQRKLSGTCMAPEGKPLACRPKDGKHPPDAAPGSSSGKK